MCLLKLNWYRAVYFGLENEHHTMATPIRMISDRQLRSVAFNNFNLFSIGRLEIYEKQINQLIIMARSFQKHLFSVPSIGLFLLFYHVPAMMRIV